MQHLRAKLENFGWVSLDHAVRLVIGLVAMTLVAPHLGPDGFAIYVYIFALLSLVMPAARFGVSVIVVRDLLQSPALFDAIMGTAISLSAMLAILGTGLVCLSILLASTPAGVDIGKAGSKCSQKRIKVSLKCQNSFRAEMHVLKNESHAC